jgi:hypothetical protein
MIPNWGTFWGGFFAPGKGHESWKCFIHPYTIISREDLESERRFHRQEGYMAFVDYVDGSRMVYMAK